MRKADQKAALELVDILQKANTEIKRLVKQKNIIELVTMLSECQNSAISLGTMIEESEGEGFCTVRILEEYCEQLYLLHEMLMSADEVGATAQADELPKIIDTAKNSIQNDIKVRMEAVFLPYKASMWDSLESMWKKKAADPEWDAYVIPIPYFDKKSDGTAKEMHYEGNLYPEKVPITFYNDYDFQRRHPDEIYIHNPYDDGNLVTSVHPFFYSSNLKQFTDKLIYIPYFVLGDFNPENEEALETIKHFVVAPGVINADKVILQSENMRQAYINILTRLSGEDTRFIWEERISGEGSPKFDKVIHAKKEEQEIPATWMKKIVKSDGSWKKIVLYNNSVTAFLKNEEKMLAKMERVFQVFYENRENITLLWRPHPLMKATIESMRPRLWKNYEEIVSRYKEENWGIYDDTADLDRAIAISDAYYGDPSSLVQLCQKKGMPIMVQNCDVK